MLLMVFTVLLPYGVGKINEYMQNHNWSDPKNMKSENLKDKLKYMIYKVIHLMQNIYKICSFLNFLKFMITSSKRNVAERILGVGMGRIDPD